MAPNKVFLLGIFCLQLLAILPFLRFWKNAKHPLSITSKTRIDLAKEKWKVPMQPVKYPQFPNTTWCGARGFHKNVEQNSFKDADVLHFLDYLNDYAKLHRKIMAGELPLKVIRLVCPPSHLPCEGWGDRLKGILNVIVVAMITKRAFVLGNIADLTPDSTIDMFYGNSDFMDWSKVIPQNATYEFRCFRKFKINCLRDTIKNGTFENDQVVDFVSNMDHSFNLAREFPEFLAETRIHQIPFWKSLVMQRFFPIKPDFAETVMKVIPQVPLLGVHIRTGWIKNDDARYLGNLTGLMDSYLKCIDRVCPSNAFSTATAFAATDNSEALDLLTTRLKEMGIWRVITAENVGELGHNSRDPGHSNLALRMMVEFEILRRVPVMIVANSGFSLMAHRVRYHARSMAYTGLDTCSSLPTKHVGFYFSVGYW